jgi:hypothetical protein
LLVRYPPQRGRCPRNAPAGGPKAPRPPPPPKITFFSNFSQKTAKRT